MSLFLFSGKAVGQSQESCEDEGLCDREVGVEHVVLGDKTSAPLHHLVEGPAIVGYAPG